MIRFSQKHWFFYFILLVILISDIAVLFDVPVLRQIFGFLFLFVVPGLLLLIILKPSGLKGTEQGILVVGLSISFIYFFGLFINTLLPLFDYNRPLATQPLLAMINCAFFACLAVIWYRNSNPLELFSRPRLTRLDHIMLIFPVIVPVLMIVAVSILNITGNNLPILVVVCFIFGFAACMAYLKKINSPHIYPIILVAIAISLLAFFMLRFPHIWGNDIQSEYGQAFLDTLDLLRWQSSISTLTNILSVTLLPTVFQSICSVGYLELFFKWIFVSACITTPLAVFCIARKYICDFYAFFAALFYIVQFGYLSTAGSPRTNIAIMFAALTIFVLFNDDLNGLQKGSLAIIFLASVIVSHYATAYIFFFIFIFVLIASWILRKRYAFHPTIRSFLVAFFFVFIFLWYFQVTDGILFQQGVTFIDRIFNSLDILFSSDVTTTNEATQLFSPSFQNKVLSFTNWIVVWSSLVFIGFGILYSLMNFKKITRITNSLEPAPEFLISRFESELILMALIGVGLLGALTIIKVISEGYDSSRLFSLTSILLSIFLIIGILSFLDLVHRILSFFQYTGDIRYLDTILTVGLIVLYGLFTLGVPYQFSGISQFYYNNEDNNYVSRNIHDSEGFAALWLKKESMDDTKILVPGYPASSLLSIGRISKKRIENSIPSFNPSIQYIYFGYLDIAKEYYIKGALKSFPKWSLSEGQQKIYANRGAEIFMVK